MITRGGAVALGLIVGGAIPLDLVWSDSRATKRSWMRWLVRVPDDYENQSTPVNATARGLTTSPGRVYAWGASFGKDPQHIAALGDNNVKVAVSEGLIAALNDQGDVHTYLSHHGAPLKQKIDIYGSAASVAIRSSAKELIILDASGRVYTSPVDSEGNFNPAKVMQGALSRVKVRRVECGKNHCVAVTENGEAIAWGDSNSHGQLGREPDLHQKGKDTHVPVHVKLPEDVQVTEAACGDKHTLFMDQTGDLYATGDDHWAQLGISAEPWLKTHVKKCMAVRRSELLRDLVACNIAGGGQHSVMLVKDGTVFSFGFNQWGQLGHHNYSSLAPPSPIADYTIRALAVSAGENHTCLVKDTGELLCIGANDHGQLGNNTLQPSMTWKKVRLGKKPMRPSFIHANGHTCAAIVAQENTSA